MKKSFKKLGFVSLATSSVLLGSMNATDLETYATLQKPSHVFGNYAAKTEKENKDNKKMLQKMANQVQAVAVALATQTTPLQVAHQIQPVALKKRKAVAVAHQVQAVIAWQAS